MGSGLLQLAVGAALVTGSILFISEQSQPVLQCPPGGPSWGHQMVLRSELPFQAAGAEGGAPDPAVASAVTGMAAEAMRHVGWRIGTKFARFDASASLQGVLRRPWSHGGAFLLIVPGNGTLSRRLEHVPFISIDPAAEEVAAGLTEALSPAAAALNVAAGAVESALGRRLFAFRLEAAPLPACSAGSGPCAVWEPSSGRVVLDTWLAGKMAGLDAAAAAAEPAAGGALLPGSMGGAEAAGSAGSAAGLHALLARFVEKVAEQAAEATGLLTSGKASLPALAGTFAKAGASAVPLVMAGGPTPLWWCITCPLVLGMLAPFVFNYGLTAAAEALCAQLQLPDDTCSDLWWGAFALALALSLGAAVPIVYICRLPECGRRAGATVAAASLAVARMAAS